MVCLSCTATGERVCLAAEGFGNRHCFLENIADKVSSYRFKSSVIASVIYKKVHNVPILPVALTPFLQSFIVIILHILLSCSA